eukprot:tig00000241_g20861.t1
MATQEDRDEALARALQQQEYQAAGYAGPASRPSAPPALGVPVDSAPAYGYPAAGYPAAAAAPYPGQPVRSAAAPPSAQQGGAGAALSGFLAGKPYVVIALSVVNVVMFLVELWAGRGFAPPAENPLLGPSTDAMVSLGAKDSTRMRDGDWWRFLAPTFLHGGVIHLAVILFSLLGFGIQVERAFGSPRTAAVYLISGVGGTLASALMDPASISVGASGAVFGLVGAMFAFVGFNWGAIDAPRRALAALLVTAAVNFIIGLLVKFVDNWAHLGGFFCGLCAGAASAPTAEKLPARLAPRWHGPVRAAGALLLVAYLTLCFALFYAGIAGPGPVHVNT